MEMFRHLISCFSVRTVLLLSGLENNLLWSQQHYDLHCGVDGSHNNPVSVSLLDDNMSHITRIACIRVTYGL